MGRSHGGFPDFGYLDPYRPQAPYQLSGAQGGSLCPTALGPSALNREPHLQVLGDTISRHVHDCVEHPPSLVHVSNSGATSPSGECSVSELAGEVNVHVSSIHSAQQSHSEALVHPGGRSNSHSPLVAKTVVVSTPTSSLCGSPPVLSLPSRSSVTAGSECMSWTESRTICTH